MLEIIAHRGLWQDTKNPNDKSAQNTLKAFERAFESGFGVEMDLRDFAGQIVISHDIATPKAPPLREFLTLHASFCTPHFTPPLALNIKADGLQALLKRALSGFGGEYFAFDMSLPDTLGYAHSGLCFYLRQSEFEPRPSRALGEIYKNASGVWLDGFFENFLRQKHILEHLKNGKKLCIVSPELHNLDFTKEWKKLRQILKKIQANSENLGLCEQNLRQIALCTDYPFQAREFFDKI